MRPYLLLSLLTALLLGLLLEPGSDAATLAQASPQRWRVGLSQAGLHRITRAELVAAGMPVDDVDPRQLQLSRSIDGIDRPLPVLVTGEADGRLDAGDTIYFYGQGLPRPAEGKTFEFFGRELPLRLGDRLYTDEQAYWLSIVAAPAARMAGRQAAPSGAAPVVEQHRHRQRAEESKLYSLSHWTSDELWFWNRMNSGDPVFTRTYAIELSAPAVSSNAALVEAEIASRREGMSHTRFSWLGAGEALLDDRSWEGRRSFRMRAEMPQSKLAEGSNAIQLEIIKGEANADILFDWLTVEYDRRLELEAGQLSFEILGEGPREFRVGGLTGSPALTLDISDPQQPLQLSDIPTPAPGSPLAFEAAAGRRYHVAELDSALPPSSLRRAVDGGIMDGREGADYIVIAPPALLEGSLRLAERREVQGLRSRVVNADAIYDRFNDGNFHPKAIRAFLRHAVATWPAPAPRFVLLVGDGHWNFKDDGDGKWPGGPVLMPPYLNFADPFQGMVDTTNRLAAVIDDDPPFAPDGSDNVPDLAIGRLPVSSPAELEVMIDKIVSFEEAPPAPWRSQVLLVADNSDRVPQPSGWGEFARDNEQVAREMSWTSAEIKRLYLDDWFNGADGRECGPAANGQRCPGAVESLVSRLSESALFVNYVGHGSIGNWAHENLLRSSDLPALDNPGRLPVVTSWNCFDGYWLFPGWSSLAETMLRQPGKGAAAAFAPAGLGITGVGPIMSTAFYRAVRGGATYLGEATLASLEAGRRSHMVDIYVLLGDPAMRLNLPPQMLNTVTPTARPSATATAGGTLPATPSATPSAASSPTPSPLASASPSPSATLRPGEASATPGPVAKRVYLPRLERSNP